MTFTEAAVEVLRRAGKPLHYKEIADAALRENLLSHVGQDPEITMGRRPAARARREDDRKVVAVMPGGTFALLEWAVPQELQVEAVVPPMQPAETGEPLYRPREREPRAIHAQARRRLAELQAEHEEGSEEVEAERRRQDQGRKGQRRFPDRKSTRLNSSHLVISYAVFCLKKKKTPPKTLSMRICVGYGRDVD